MISSELTEADLDYLLKNATWIWYDMKCVYVCMCKSQ